ncbi:MAG: HypC/HybG/HupF family hydrogenase formation chaperone [Deferribacterota bacterium]|nr:HypC/HybG/HupF family hydrogenase formation chaperone [Deferribacterota bacterium]
MCLAVPMRVVKVYNEYEAEVESLGVRQKISTELLDNIKEGDYVLIHAGCAIEILDIEAAKESLELWKELLANEENGDVWQ